MKVSKTSPSPTAAMYAAVPVMQPLLALTDTATTTVTTSLPCLPSGSLIVKRADTTLTTRTDKSPSPTIKPSTTSHTKSKTTATHSPTATASSSSGNSTQSLLLEILLPILGFAVLVAVIWLIWWSRRRSRAHKAAPRERQGMSQISGDTDPAARDDVLPTSAWADTPERARERTDAAAAGVVDVGPPDTPELSGEDAHPQSLQGDRLHRPDPTGPGPATYQPTAIRGDGQQDAAPRRPPPVPARPAEYVGYGSGPTRLGPEHYPARPVPELTITAATSPVDDSGRGLVL